MHIAEMHVGPEGYLLLFVCVFAEQIGLPLPATPALLAAGALAATGGLSMPLIIVVAVAASVLSDFLWYHAGGLGNKRMRDFLGRHPESRILRRAERLFARYGGSSLVFAKFVPGLSLVLPPLSGTYGISAARFLLFDSLGSFVWAGSFAGIGYFSGSTMHDMVIQISWRWFGWLLAAIAFSIAVVGFGRALLRRRRAAAVSFGKGTCVESS